MGLFAWPMLPVFIFMALPTLSLALLVVVAYRKLGLPLLSPRQQRAQSDMSRPEALQLLGLSEEADRHMIHEAHKRLLLNYRRNRGNKEMTARLNLARDTLLRMGKN